MNRLSPVEYRRVALVEDDVEQRQVYVIEKGRTAGEPPLRGRLTTPSILGGGRKFLGLEPK